MPARRMHALVTGLPDDAAVWRPDRRGWSQQDELLARLIEVTDAWGRVVAFGSLMAASNARLKKPPEFPESAIGGAIEHPGRPRPEPKAPRRKRVRMTEFVDRFERGG